MLNVTVVVSGKTLGDLEVALEEVKRLVSDGYTSGYNRGEAGSFSLEVSGEEEEEA